MKKLNIAVIFGGCSSEYSVSLESASGVISHMDKSRFTPVLIGITKRGDWYHYAGNVRHIADDTWAEQDCEPCCISSNRGSRELLVFIGNEIQHIHLDAVFPILHGRNGEDGTVQGLCELAGIPIVGCGTLASALCMDKTRAHKLVSLTGIRVPNAIELTKGCDIALVRKQAMELAYPLFVKPVKAGSSFGVAKVSDPELLEDAIEKAFYYDDRVLLEENIPGFELGCAVMGNDALSTGELDEIELSHGFFDYTEKYNLATSKIHVPARVLPAKAVEIKETAKTIYRALDCSGFARVDMFLTPDGELVFNEVNTIPGFTPHSRFPSMMKSAGLSFDAVVTRAIELALEK
ncbi:MAG: D-alanine--D-serine ligase VanG [Oscillospiraceae bacterium]